MNKREIDVGDKLAERFPGQKVAYAFAEGIGVRSTPSELETMLSDLESETREAFREKPLDSHPSLESWLTIAAQTGMLELGEKPAPIGLLERFQENQHFPKINSVVDVTNLIAVKYLTPVGAFDLDSLRGEVRLRLSEEGEVMIPLFKDEPDMIPEGEIIYSDDEGPFSRYSIDADRSKISDSTTDVLFVVDGTTHHELSEIENARDELMNLVARFSGEAESVSKGSSVADSPL